MKQQTALEKTIGQILEDDFLKPLNLTQSSLAKATHVPRARISDIITGKRTITPDTDLRLCRYLGLEDGYFLRIQEKMELKKVKTKLGKELNTIKPHKGLFDGSVSFSDKTDDHKIHIALICGGPSRERGISLNSGRSLMDHLTRDEIELHPLYVDHNRNFYEISKSQLYSNTPSDFDFKLTHTAKKLSHKSLIKKLEDVDIVFPVIHGAFGEDGGLQEILEKNNIPFVGSGSKACQKMFHKYKASTILSKHGYETLPSKLLKKNDVQNDPVIKNFFKQHDLKRAIVKPVAGGSSIGVFSVTSAEEAIEKTRLLFDMEIDEEAIIEPFCYGKEFTLIVLQNPDGTPVSLIPSEIQVSYEKGKIFDYRRKYLPTTNTKWPCPPHFDDETVITIQRQAEHIFGIFGMRDTARLDGWVLDNGHILFTDLNPISGMEQNSFIFQQTTRTGFTHRDILWNIVCKACHREGIEVKELIKPASKNKKKVHVLFGGKTAERQVSIMSGTNVWLKLLHSKTYEAEPYFLDLNGNVWHLPYTYALSHTAEEIYDNCLTASATSARLEKLTRQIHTALDYAPMDYDIKKNLPKKYSFEQFVKISKEENAFVFLALHGGEGENGSLQQLLEAENLPYNGSDPEASELCMDKYLTGEAVLKIADPDIITAPKKQIQITKLSTFTDNDYETFWKTLQKELNAKTLIIKPQNDGCSAGIIRLYSAEDLKKYVHLVHSGALYIEENTFKNQTDIIEMPQNLNTDYMIEAFIETDDIRIEKNKLAYHPKTNWIELTVGVMEKEGHYHAFNPSIAIAEGEILSLEEKFQGGTGINITPPPEDIITQQQCTKIKNSIEKIAKALGIENYARLDVFFNTKTNKILLIEANSLPGLTGSTVIFHQALAEPIPMNPQQLLEKIIEFKMRA